MSYFKILETFYVLDTKQELDFSQYDYVVDAIDTMALPKGNYGNIIKGMYWAPMHLCDCIAAGGTKEKPDFW